MPDEIKNEAAPTSKNRMLKKSQMKVRANHALHEDGEHHSKGAEFELPADRVAALGDSVMVIN